jgi:hypothetical protein
MRPTGDRKAPINSKLFAKSAPIRNAPEKLTILGDLIQASHNSLPIRVQITTMKIIIKKAADENWPLTLNIQKVSVPISTIIGNADLRKDEIKLFNERLSCLVLICKRHKGNLKVNNN